MQCRKAHCGCIVVRGYITLQYNSCEMPACRLFQKVGGLAGVSYLTFRNEPIHLIAEAGSDQAYGQASIEEARDFAVDLAVVQCIDYLAQLHSPIVRHGCGVYRHRY